MSKFYHNCNTAGKRGWLIFKDKSVFAFEYGKDNYYEAQKLLSVTIGFVWEHPSGIWAEAADSTKNIYVKGESVHDAVDKFHAEYLENLEYNSRYNEDKLFQLEERLKGHDWTFMFSDDHAHWSSGNANLNAIRRLVKETAEQGSKLWNTYCPEDMKI